MRRFHWSRPAVVGAALLMTALALGLHASGRAPARWPVRAWMLGPPAAELEAAARAEIERARTFLNDERLGVPERLTAYRERLVAAESLLIRALRANPVLPRALAELSVVRWELDPPLERDALSRHLEQIALASRIAPGMPAVQRRLGELLLAMGRREEAFVYLGRAIELDPRSSPEVVERVRRYLASPLAALDRLPARAEVVLALVEWLLEQGRHDDLLAALERVGIADDPRLLRAYGRTCLDGGLAERLERRMSSLDTVVTEAVAERRVQRSLARRALGDLEGAIADAREARAVLPASDRLAEHLGRTLLHAGRGDEAAEVFREALGLAAAASAGKDRRAVLYRLAGQAEEAAGRPHLAYDAYKRALRLAADEPVARRRVAEMEAAPR